MGLIGIVVAGHDRLVFARRYVPLFWFTRTLKEKTTQIQDLNPSGIEGNIFLPTQKGLHKSSIQRHSLDEENPEGCRTIKS